MCSGAVGAGPMGAVPPPSLLCRGTKRHLAIGQTWFSKTEHGKEIITKVGQAAQCVLV